MLVKPVWKSEVFMWSPFFVPSTHTFVVVDVSLENRSSYLGTRLQGSLIRYIHVVGGIYTFL